MTDDWKGEHLIRGVRLTGAERHRDYVRQGTLRAQKRGASFASEKTKVSHKTFVRAVMRLSPDRPEA